MAVTGNTELTAVKEQAISALVQKELISASVLASNVYDVSGFCRPGAQTISFPRAGSFTVEDRASAAQASIQSLTFAKDTLTLGFMATVAWTIDPQDAIETPVDVEAEYAKRAARAHGVYVDQKLILELEAAGVATTTAGNISDAVILEMRQALMQRKANMRNLRLAISPAQEAVLLGINKYTLAQDYGRAVIPEGVLSQVYGIPILVTPELATQQFFMYDVEGICLGFQKGPQMDERKAPEYGSGAMLKVLDQKFGVKGLEINQQGVGATESALIVKDNN
jgi:hypothetical protein